MAFEALCKFTKKHFYLETVYEHPLCTLNNLSVRFSGDPNSPPIHAHHNGSGLDSPTANGNNAMNGGGGGGGSNNSSGNNGANNASNNSSNSMATTAGIETEPVMYYEPR